MNPRKQNILTLIRITVDILMVLFAWGAAWVIRLHSGMEVVHGVPAVGLYLKLMPFIARA